MAEILYQRVRAMIQYVVGVMCFLARCLFLHLRHIDSDLQELGAL